MSNLSSVQTIKQLFELNIQFRIPAYQRAYSWESKDASHPQVPQFIDDIIGQEEGKEYYLGHFLFESTDDTSSILHVIDGQQRLTTVVLFISSLVRGMKNRSLAEHLETVDRLDRTYLQRGGGMRLETVSSDNNYFYDIIRGGATLSDRQPRSQRRLYEAARYFDRIIERESDERLLRWLSIIETAAISTYQVRTKIQATQIFSLQNDRGKGLTNLEKLKAFLAYQVYLNSTEGAEPREIKYIEWRFSEIYRICEAIELLSEDQVLDYHCKAYLDRWKSPMEVIKHSINSLLTREQKVEWIRSFALSLHDSFSNVQDLEILAAADERIADPIILDSSNAWPILIKLYKRNQKSIVYGKFDRLLRLIELCLFKYKFLHGGCANDLNEYALSLYHSNQSRSLTEAQVIEKLEFASKYSFRGGQDCNAAFKASFSWGNHWNPTFRYLLWKYELDRRQPKDYSLSPRDYMNVVGRHSMDSTLDHVSPRTPQGPQYSEKFSREYLNNLGNLLLMPHGLNSSFKNDPPVQKAEGLAKSSLVSHREVAETIKERKDWGEMEIESRRNGIFVFATKRWEA